MILPRLTPADAELAEAHMHNHGGTVAVYIERFGAADGMHAYLKDVRTIMSIKQWQDKAGTLDCPPMRII